jgi:hypothetical protein
MNRKTAARSRGLTEDQIDAAVISEIDDESAWGEAIEVRRAQDAALKIPRELAARAAFLARLHRKPDVQDWITQILRERIEIEETAFVEMKRDLAKGRA